MPKLHGWEEVKDEEQLTLQSFRTFRMAVPTGWIYYMWDTNERTGYTTFVPKAVK